MAIIVKCDNGTVTDTYMELIGQVLTDLGEKNIYVDSSKMVYSFPKDELIVVALSLEAFQLILHGYRHILFWNQGLAPEENYLVRKSWIKLSVFNIIEWFTFRHVDFMLFVSETMKRYIYAKYKIIPDDKFSYCMPCMNTGLHPDAFLTKNKYNELSFVYVGSMRVWQSFEDTVDLYAKIEKTFNYQSKLFVFTADQEIAVEVLRNKGVEKYVIDYVPNEKLPSVLAGIKYGFILRKDNIVNRVATPTKISTYLSCGVIPIYSSCLEDFTEVAQNMTYAVSYSEDVIDKLKAIESRQINPDDVLKEYKMIFDTYYNQKKHMKNLKEKLKPVYEQKWKK